MHTTCSDGQNSYEEMVQKALELQLDFIAVTDHVGYAEGSCVSETIAKCQAETRLLCIPSTEQTTATFHLLAIGIQSRFGAFQQPLVAQVEEIHRQGGLAIAAHPYDKTRNFTENQLLHSGLDAMECARGTREQNQQQWQLSEQYNIPCVYNSDAHKKDDLGKQYNVCSVPINTVADLKAALIGKKCKMK
jgi:predicted metal-dependent phosphoesterase TrpH